MKQLSNKRIFQVLLISGTILSLFFVPWILVKAWILPLPDSIEGQVEQATRLGFGGIVVFVDQKGQPPAHYAAGWHDPKRNIPADPQALFKIASIQKLYTAVAVTKLSVEKKLDLDKTLTDYFPDLKDRIEHAGKITLRMMVQHRSGIPDYTYTPEYWASPKENNTERLALVLDQPGKFKPDEDHGYSNTNYLLLAEIMNKVLGYDHFEYIRENVLNSLHLRNTFKSIHEVNPEDIMSGYHVGYPVDLKSDNQGMVATAEDVGIFLRALNEGSLLTQEEQATYAALYEYGHTGLVPGYQSIAKYHPDIDAVVVQFTTPSNFKGYEWNLSEIIYSRILKILQREKG